MRSNEVAGSQSSSRAPTSPPATLAASMAGNETRPKPRKSSR